MYATSRAVIRRAIDRALRLPAHLARGGSRSLLIGALILMTASSASVIATTNAPPSFTSLSLSKTQVYEGETVTLTGSFTDPNPTDRHTILVYWHGAQNEEAQTHKEKFQLPAGQTTFQFSHTYGDFVPISSIFVIIYDHEFPPEMNDNSTGSAWDAETLAFQFLDAKAQFVPSSIKVTKNAGGASKSAVPGRSVVADPAVHVTIAGQLSPREAVEPVQVTASWNGAGSSQTPCSVGESSRTFMCEHTYTSPSSIKGYPVTLRVQDDEGNQSAHQLTVRIP